MTFSICVFFIYILLEDGCMSYKCCITISAKQVSWSDLCDKEVNMVLGPT